jgi:hypothetical protein
MQEILEEDEPISLAKQYFEKTQATMKPFEAKRLTAEQEEERLQINMLINEALKQNTESVVEENLRNTDPTYYKRMVKRQFYNQRKDFEIGVKRLYGIDLQATPNKGYLFEQADQSWRSGKYTQPSKKRQEFTK